jgi:hypothetical protein
LVNRVRSKAADANGRQRLARYIIRCPFALEKMRYDDSSGTVIYRSRPHATLKRNYQLMPANAQRKANWARLIQKVYEVDPLKCTRCGGAMRIIALIAKPPAQPTIHTAMT